MLGEGGGSRGDGSWGKPRPTVNDSGIQSIATPIRSNPQSAAVLRFADVPEQLCKVVTVGP